MQNLVDLSRLLLFFASYFMGGDLEKSFNKESVLSK